MRYLDKQQLRSLLEAARAENPRHHLLILVTYLHAMRASEAVAIHTRDIQGGYLDIKRLKGSLHTRQPLISSSDPLFDEKTLLGACESGQPFGGYTRHTFRNLMVKYCKKAGIPSQLAHPHVLKRSMGKHMIKGAGIEMTREWLGHKSLASTGSYIRASQEEAFEAMKSAVMGAA